MITHNKNLCIKEGVHPFIVWAVRKSIVFFVVVAEVEDA